jgi:hypothetical protein
MVEIPAQTITTKHACILADAVVDQLVAKHSTKKPADMKRSVSPTSSNQRMAKSHVAGRVIGIVVPNGQRIRHLMQKGSGVQ